jgi:2-dehydropantoate 2-reductase
MDQLEPVLTERTTVLTLQNGVDTEDRLRRRLGRDCVVGGVAFIYSKIAEPGVIEHYKRGAVAIGEVMGHRSPRVEAIAALFREAGLSCQISDDIRRTKWEKMAWNCVFNPLTVLIDDRISRALDDPAMVRTIHDIVGEVAAVAAGLKVPLANDIADKVVKWSQEIRDIHTSMYDDWKAGRPTEIDSLNGYIVARAAELGIPAPLNQALTAMIRVVTGRERTGPGVLRLDGAVVQPVTLDRDSLSRLPSAHQLDAAAEVAPGRTARGIQLAAILDVPAPAVGVDHVTIHSGDGSYAVSLPLAQAAAHGVLLYGIADGPLPADFGGPLRLITPGLGDLCANVKNVSRIEFTRGPGADTRPSQKSLHSEPAKAPLRRYLSD